MQCAKDFDWLCFEIRHNYQPITDEYFSLDSDRWKIFFMKLDYNIRNKI